MVQVAIATLWEGDDTLPSYSKGRYGPSYVDNLRRGLARFDVELVLLSDQPGAEHSFQGYGVGGWSNILETWRPDLWPAEGERRLAIGLDTILVNDPAWLFSWDEAPVGLPLDPYEKGHGCDAVVSYDREGAALIWSEFLRSREDGMKSHLYNNRPSEMALLRALRTAHGWPFLESAPERLLSYKAHVRDAQRAWGDATLVYFHGLPKPADLSRCDPLRQHWEGA